MSSLLLDSQSVLWVLDDNPRLGPEARDLITTAGAVHASAATVWELTIKSMLGKLKVPTPLAPILADQGFLPLPITAEHAEGLRELPELAEHDPFDRLIVAQAQLSGLRLITADRVLLALGLPFITDATQ